MWCLVRFLILISANLTESLYEAQNIQLEPSNRLQKGWYYLYLNYAQASYLYRHNIALLKPAKSTLKNNTPALSSSISKYLVYSTPDWNPSNLSIRKEKLFSNYFFVDCECTDKDLLDDPAVLKVAPYEDPVLHNRYTTGYLQSGNIFGTYDEHLFGSDRFLKRMGLTGEGQIVTVADTGLDINHQFFYDTNKVGPSHRKIIHYQCIADCKEIYGGHGSHVAGTLLGKAYCNDCALHAYDGMAPDAKIYMVDVGGSGETLQTGKIFTIENIQYFREAGSRIMSNSWGSTTTIALYTEIIDQFAYLNQDFLFIFSGGNEKNYFQINSPADSKNILTVGSSHEVPLHDLEHANTRKIQLEAGGVAIDAEWESCSLDPFLITTNMTATPKTQFEIGDIGDDSLEGKAVILTSSDVQAAVGKGCSLIILFNTAVSNCPSTIPVLTTTDTRVQAFTGIVSIIFLPTTTSYTPEAAFYSSKGPTFYGLLKPDISAPGTSVVSARATNTMEGTSLYELSGTSMSAPLIAGLAAIYRQYFVEGFYPTNSATSNGFEPTSSLLKAAIIASTHTAQPTLELGHGIPNAKFFIPTEKQGLRIVDNQTISPNEHQAFTIETDNQDGDMTVVLSYIDVVLAYENYYSLYNDLDLIVESPSHKFYHGNGFGNYEHQFSTNEKVFIRKEEVEIGTYKIHVVTNNIDEIDTTYYSIVVNGPFANLDTKNPFQPDVQKEETCINDCSGKGSCRGGVCVCQETYNGDYCQHTIETLDDTSKKEGYPVEPQKVSYFRLKLSENISKTNPLNVHISGMNGYVVQIGFGIGEFAESLASNNWYVGSGSEENTIYIDETIEADHVFFFIRAISEKTISINFNFFRGFIENPPDNTGLIVGCVIAAVGIVGIGCVSIYLWKRQDHKVSSNNSEMEQQP